MGFSSAIYDERIMSSLREMLANKGHCLIADPHLFLTTDQWKTLHYQAGKICFESSSDSFNSYEIKGSVRPEVRNKPIFDVVSSIQTQHFVSALTKLTPFVVDLCAYHSCEEGASIPTEWSQKHFKGCHYMLSFFLEDSYTGGEVIIRDHKQNETTHAPQAGHILVSSCGCEFQTNPVSSGKRSHIIALLQPHPLIHLHREDM